MAPSAAPCARALTRALLASTALVGVGLPLGLSLSPGPLRAEPLPRGGQVISGGVTIGTPQGGALAITQSSQTAIVDWQGFSVGQGHRVDIRQPGANAALLNRVTGATPSTIAGQLNATGQVYLVNPNGVTITRSGQVNAAGFVASSLGISDEDFKGGRRQFRGSGASAPVTNHGAITIGRSGYAALIGGSVSNTGTISVPMGRVGLGAGERATLDLSGDGFLQVAVPTRGRGRGALVAHSGTIAADGGSVTLSAAAARDMARQAVNLSGTVEARSVSGTNGRITLSGDEGRVVVGPTARLDASGAGAEAGGRVRVAGRRLDVAGTVDVSGATGGRARLKASEHLALSGRVLAEGRIGRGGRVVATAPEIATQAARIEASGAAGGGVVRVGGGRMGQGPLARAERVSVDAASLIRADATRAGVGGDVVVWSDGATRFSGTITARGGAAGGDGGQAEVSSKGVLSYEGRTDLTAARGAFGTLLLDPYDVTISSGAQTTGGGFTATANGSVINATTLLTALGSANVTVSTGSGGGQAGAITLAASTPLAWNTGATLTLQAAGAVTLNSAVTAPAGGLTIAAGTGTSTATTGISVAHFTWASGDWVQNAATLPGFAAGDFQVAGGSFLRAAGGAGTSASPYRLTDIYGVQGMGTSSAYRAASYRLAGDIDAAGTAAWNGGAGFAPVGDARAAPFTGSFDGAGFTVTGLTIARPSQNYVGLIGNLDGGTVTNLGLEGGRIAGGSNVGGLVGRNAGTVSDASATGAVTGRGGVGGLVGLNDGTMSNASATGAVTGGDNGVGGLVGFNYGTVNNAYATGAVTGRSSNVGGLIGVNARQVSNAYATGAVASSGSYLGGLIGFNAGTLTNTYWDTDSTGTMSGVGGGGSSPGATGLTTAQARAASNYGGFDFSTVWYQAGDLRPILRSEAAPAVGGVSAVSNLHQLQLMGADLAGQYRLSRDLDASATATSAASPDVFGAGGFMPVGDNASSTTRFTGSLDGAGHRITDLTIDRLSKDYVGLIGALDTAGTVTDLGLVGGSVAGNSFVGGLIGYNQGSVSRAYATGAVIGRGNFVGGLVGVNSGTVSNVYAAGAVTGRDFVGGLVGSDEDTLSNAYATGAVTGRDFVGGLVGNNGNTLTNTYWDTATTGQGARGVGVGTSVGATGLSTADARTRAAYAGFDFDGVWYQAGDLRPMLRSQAAGPGADGVIPVSTLDQLQLMGANLAGRYRLTANIDASATAATAASPGIFGAGGFVPVGTDAARFTGALDGAGSTITGLTVARPSQSFVGLIGALGSTGRVSSLGLVGGSVTGGTYVGNLAGYNDGRITQAYATGRVTGFGDSVGGLVGYNDGPIGQAYATGNVSSSGDSVGGLVGLNFFGTVSQAYATGSVTGSTYVGGLVGRNDDSVSQAYSTGSVTGRGFVGGLVGWNNGGTLMATDWDVQTTGQRNAAGSVSGAIAGAAGLTTAQMQDLVSFRTNYTGFDFATVWAPPNQAGQGGQGSAFYPQLYGLSNVVAVTPATASRVYGSANPASIATYAGLRPGDFVTTLGTLSTGVTASSDVGDYAVTASGAAVTGAGGTAYRIVYVPGTLSITPATITVAGATGLDKTYDRSTALPGGNPGFTSAGVLFGDAVTVSAGSAAYDSARAGTRSVIVSGLSLSGAKAGNYRLSAASVTGSGTIDPAALTVAGLSALDKTYDGTTAATLAGTAAVTALRGDVVSVSGTGTGTFADKNAGLGKTVTVGGYSLAGIDAGNYTLVQPSGLSADIARANLAVSRLSALDKTYDGTTAATLAGTATVIPIGADLVALTGAVTGRFAGQNAGPGIPVILSGLGLTGLDAGNYALSLPTLSAAISPAALTYTAAAAARTYGAANPTLAGTVTGFVAGESLSSATTGTLAFGTAATSASDVGTYAVSGFGLGAVDGNYVFVQAATNAGALTVDPALLSVSGSRSYDATAGFATAQLGVTGGQNGETVTLIRGSGTAASADAGLQAGSALTGLAVQVAGGNARAGNYRLPTTGTLSITPAPVHVTATGGRSTYGDAPADPGLSATGLQGGQDVRVLTGLSNGFGIDAATGAGRYGLVVVGALSNGNYTVAARTPGIWQVDPRPLTLTADAQSRVYGDADPALTYRIGGLGLINGDRLSGGLASDADAASGVGRYAIGQGSLAASANYALTYQGAELTVTPRPVTLTGTRVYDAGAGIVGGALTAGNRVNGDAVTVSGSGTLAGRDVGLQALSDVSGLALSNPNYTLTGAGGAVTVTPATLTYTADAARRRYGAANPALSGTVTGLLGPDTLPGATTGRAFFATAAGTGSNVGVYAVTGAGLAAGNYVFVQAPGNADALTVDPAGLAVTGARTYDATTGFRFGQLAVSGGANGETLTLTAGSGVTASADAGLYADASLTGLSLSVAAGNGSVANYRLPATGTLAITPATVTVRVDDGRSTYGDAPAHPGLAATGLVGGQDAGVLTGLATGFDLDAASAAGRYTIAVAGRLSNGNYRVEGVESGTYTIERRPLTVAADAIARLYGDATPVLTYTVGGRGLANGDRLTGDLATAAAAGSDVGRYAIGQGTLAASADYALTWRGADLTVTPRPITVFADPQTRRAGTVNPSLTYTVGGRGLVAGDRLTGALATTAGAESEPGLYPITRGSLAASANYGLGFVGATLAVLPAQPQPQPRPVDSDPAGLASTAERVARRDARPVDPDPPLLLGASPDGALRVSDPRFDAILACAGQQGGCFLKPLPRAPMALPAPVPAPTPQASLPASTR